MNIPNFFRIFIALPILGLFSCGPINEVKSEENGNKSVVLYSWVELYADGKLDTIYSLDTSAYSGGYAVDLTVGESFNATVKIANLDSLDAIIQSAIIDTVYLNYGDAARDSLKPIIPKFTQREYILNALDTISFGLAEFKSAEIKVLHGANDGVQIEVSDSMLLSLGISPSTEYCIAENPCSLNSSMKCDQITYVQEQIFAPAIYLKMNRKPLSNPDKIEWSIILKNRFGFADTLRGSTVIVAANCPEIIARDSTCKLVPSTAQRGDTLYTWIEPFADGHKDTIWGNSRRNFVGDQSVLWTQSSGNYPVIKDVNVSVTEEVNWVCPGDSLWYNNDYELMWKPALDTTFLNYGPNAKYALVEPKITITDKSMFLSHADTAKAFTKTFGINLNVQHYWGDSAQFNVYPDTSMQLEWGMANPTGGCYVVNPCEEFPITMCTELVSYSITYPILSLKNQPDSTSSSVNPWKIVVSNRFGYKDSLEGVTHVVSFTCAK